MNYFLDPIIKGYFDFKGTATRKQYWLFFFFVLLFTVILSMIDMATGYFDMESGMGLFGVVFQLFIFIPSLAILVRRLHDAGFSGWWVLVGLIPMLGVLILLVLALLPSKVEGNKYRETLSMEGERS